MKRGHGLRVALSCTALFAVVGLGTAAASEDSSSRNWTYGISQGGLASNFDPALMGTLPQSQTPVGDVAKLFFNYLDRSGRPRTRSRGGEGDAPRLSGRQDIHVPDQAGLPVQHRSASQGGQLRVGDQQRPQPADGLAGSRVPDGYRGRPGRDRRKSQNGVGSPCARRGADDPPDQTRARHRPAPWHRISALCRRTGRSRRVASLLQVPAPTSSPITTRTPSCSRKTRTTTVSVRVDRPKSCGRSTSRSIRSRSRSNEEMPTGESSLPRPPKRSPSSTPVSFTEARSGAHVPCAQQRPPALPRLRAP